MIPNSSQYSDVEADLVAKVVETADAVLGIFEIVVLDEPKA
jgi:hypothetical protein